MFENLSSQQLAKAARLKEQIENLEGELEGIIGGQGSATSTSTSPSAKRGRPAGKGGMSAEGKARIAAGQKARWAKFNAEKGSSSPAAKPKRTMSAAAKAKIASAARKRWKRAKAAGKTKL